MKNKIRIIAGSVLFLAIIVFFLYYSYLSNLVKPIPAGTVGNTAGNSYNSGLFCEYNGEVYFSNPYDNGSLYSMSLDESNFKKLTSVSVSFLNAGGDYLFFFQKQASGSAGLGFARTLQGVYRSTLSGKDITCLKRCLVFNLQLVDNYLYYLTSGDQGTSFCKLKTDKSDEKILEKNGVNFACAQSDGTIYYNGDERNHYLYRFDTHSDSSSTIWKGNLWYPVYDNGYIYYLDVESDYRLSRYSLSEDVVEILTHDRIDCYNLAGGYIYYQKNSTEDPALKRMTLDGQNVETIMQGNYTNINVAGQYVYFTAFGSDIPIYRTPISGPIAVSSFDGARDAALKYSKTK
ncbi:MAG TPA: DUF5050 domain-containing protein [Lachnospiraceae bacterium]|nr:DUF5050 domain-containing protein [Lachnospiraceae bacterium]